MARRVQFFTNQQRDTVIAILDDRIVKKVRFSEQNGYISIKADKTVATAEDLDNIRKNYSCASSIEHFEAVLDNIVNHVLSLTNTR